MSYFKMLERIKKKQDPCLLHHSQKITLSEATIISYHSCDLRFHPFSFVWKNFFLSHLFSPLPFGLSKYFIFCSLLYKGFLNEVQIFPSEDYPIIRTNDLKFVLVPQNNARHLTWLMPVLISTEAAPWVFVTMLSFLSLPGHSSTHARAPPPPPPPPRAPVLLNAE